jgi:hypothetical protein
MIYFFDDANSDVVTDAIQAYSQGWCFLDVIDSLHPKRKLVSPTVIKEFNTIQNIWKNHVKTIKNSDHNQSNMNVWNLLLK